MTWQFQKVCRQCGAQLVTLPKILHPFHMRVFVRGPRAALQILTLGLLTVVLIYGVVFAAGLSGPLAPVIVGIGIMVLAALGFIRNNPRITRRR
jgi:hypothetical protein